MVLIGKIGAPTAILDKPGKLDPEEMQLMRDHVTIGVRILEPIPCFHEVVAIVAQHHEWFDGAGYPAGLLGENINLHARIVAPADTYDAIISDRPYRRRLSKPQAIEIVRRRREHNSTRRWSTYSYSWPTMASSCNSTSRFIHSLGSPKTVTPSEVRRKPNAGEGLCVSRESSSHCPRAWANTSAFSELLPFISAIFGGRWLGAGPPCKLNVPGGTG